MREEGEREEEKEGRGGRRKERRGNKGNLFMRRLLTLRLTYSQLERIGKKRKIQNEGQKKRRGGERKKPW